MLDNVLVGSYFPTNTILNHFHSFSKMFLLLILSISIGITNNSFVLIIFAIFTLMLIYISKIPKKKYLKMIGSIKILLILTFITSWIFLSLNEAYIMVLKFIVLVLTGSIFLYTTRLKDMMKGIDIFIYPLRIFKINCDEISLILILTIRFIPIVIEIANQIVKSMICRGLKFYSSIESKIKIMPTLLFSIIVKTIYSTDHFSDTLIMRTTFEDSKKKIDWNGWGVKDSFLILFSFVILIFVIVKEVGII